MTERTAEPADTRADIRDFLISRRARISPSDVGLPVGNRRRVTGLRREEVAVLAGVSIDWYTRLEKGHISGVSDDVLEAVARALRLDDAERTYLFELARTASPRRRATRPRKSKTSVPPRVQWMLDSITQSAAFIANDRLDILATNPLGRALFTPMYTDSSRAPNFARFQFLDPAAHDFHQDWDGASDITVALLRMEAGRHPNDKELRELVGELSTVSEEFRNKWATHNVRVHHAGTKQFNHPTVGPLDLGYYTTSLVVDDETTLTITIYTAEPGTDSADRLQLLGSWTATQSPSPERIG